ncbi:MAG: NAD-dependent epimerase/dehydratase family protein, partial [Bdellovibrionales bacterium]|nr:NAD-dependent epimerase/dehydratase family protein [Bdellovibrionales bacterium]
MAKFLITGANGFLGSWLLKKLIEEGHDCLVLHRATSDLSEIDGLPYKSRVGDILDYNSLKAAAEGCDTIFHLAGLIAYRRVDRPMMDKVNVQGTVNVVRACKEMGVRRLVHVSSVVALGASFDGRLPLNEKSQFNLAHLNLGYFETKRKAEVCVLNAAHDQGLDAVVVNPSTIYGPG